MYLRDLHRALLRKTIALPTIAKPLKVELIAD